MSTPLRAAPLALVLLTLPAPPAAAAGAGARVLAAPPGPPVPVVVSARTGRVVARGDAAAGYPEAASTTVCFDDAFLTGLFVLPAAGDELVDWGVKTCGGTDLVERLVLAYATTALDPAAGGPGARFDVALYLGTTGTGILGTETARFTLSGLPGAAVAGTTAAYLLTLDFGNLPALLPDGPIGWGFHALDGQSGPLLARAPDPALGTLDALDTYSPGPATLGSYTGSGPPLAGASSGSIALRIEELLPDPPASSVVVPGSGTNPLVFQELQPAVLGRSWLALVDLSGFPTANLTAVGISEVPFTPVAGPFGELLVDPRAPDFFLDLGFGLHAAAIPVHLDVIGRLFHTQAIVRLAPSGLVLTNGLDVTIGF